ncbi:MAG: RDD family protein [Actinobacteria bacterium]|nr:RDD family protein [Actinomycetota bacterium]
MSRRVTGAVIDLLILLFAAGALSSLITTITPSTAQVRIDAEGARTIIAGTQQMTWLPLLVLVILTALYVVPLMALFGRTIGGALVGIKCVRADTGKAPGWGVSLRRWLLLYGIAGALGFAPYVGGFAWLVTLVVGLSPLWDISGRLRGYADRFAGDIVVRTRAVR